MAGAPSPPAPRFTAIAPSPRSLKDADNVEGKETLVAATSVKYSPSGNSNGGSNGPSLLLPLLLANAVAAVGALPEGLVAAGTRSFTTAEGNARFLRSKKANRRVFCKFTARKDVVILFTLVTYWSCIIISYFTRISCFEFVVSFQYQTPAIAIVDIHTCCRCRDVYHTKQSHGKMG